MMIHDNDTKVIECFSETRIHRSREISEIDRYSNRYKSVADEYGASMKDKDVSGINTLTLSGAQGLQHILARDNANASSSEATVDIEPPEQGS